MAGGAGVAVGRVVAVGFGEVAATPAGCFLTVVAAGDLAVFLAGAAMVIVVVDVIVDVEAETA